MKQGLLAAVVISLFLAPGMAQAEPVHAVALHGEPKYKADFTHLDYVNPDAPKGGTLRLDALGTFDSLNPYIVKGAPAAGLAALGSGLIYESLTEQSYDEPFTEYGLLAETIDLAADRSSITYTLRTQARWHDGKPVTAEDVVWTFKTLMEKGSPFYQAYYADVGAVTAEGERTVRFTLKNPENRELPMIIGQLPVLPKHYWTTEGRDIGKTTLTPPLGSGPYKIGNVEPGRSIQYSRVTDWWGKDLPINRGRYNFDTIVYDYYRDANVALEAFFAGRYDVRQENIAKLWASAYDAPAVKDGRIVKAEIKHERPQGVQGFLYNLRRPMFQDPAVREALAYAFDFDWSNKQLAFGSYKRSRSYFSNSELAATGVPSGRELEILEQFRGQIPDAVFTTEYNPPKTDGSGNNRDGLKKAADMLEKAGYKLGPDRVRVHEKTGQRLEFEILDNNSQFDRWINPFIKNLERIGVKATFRIVDVAQYQNRMNDFDYDMTVGVIPQSDSPGNEQLDFWGSAKADAPGSRNYIGIKNPVVDALIKLIIEAPSREELVARVHALDRVLQWNFYIIPHWHLDHWRIAWWNKLDKPANLSGMTPAITDTWWVKQDKP